MTKKQQMDQYLVTSSGTIVRPDLGITRHFNHLPVGEDMPNTLSEAAKLVYAECSEDSSIRVLLLNFSDLSFTDVTVDVAKFVALNLFDRQNEDENAPEWFKPIIADWYNLTDKTNIC